MDAECGVRTFPVAQTDGPFPAGKRTWDQCTPPPYASSGYGHTTSYGVRHLAMQMKPDTKCTKCKKFIVNVLSILAYKTIT